jgi:hypothetical protein
MQLHSAERQEKNEQTATSRRSQAVVAVLGAAICLGVFPADVRPAVPRHANDNIPRTPLVQKTVHEKSSRPAVPAASNHRRPASLVARPAKKFTPTASSRERQSKLLAVRLLREYVLPRYTGVECGVDRKHLIIEDPWTGEIERIHFADATIRVDHPRFERSDRASGGLKSPLVVTARQSSDAEIAPRQCVIYSTLLMSEHVTRKTWRIVDRLLAALAKLGATVEQSRPEDDLAPMDGEVQ